jgi:hypothetical protein
MKLHSTVSAIALLSSFMPHEGKAGWKVVKEGDKEYIALKDGNPIWVNTDGTETTLGGDTITRLNSEAKTHREGKEAAEAKLTTLETKFKDIDPDKARKAVEDMSKIDAKKLIDAGEVDRVKESMRSEFTGQIEAANKGRDEANRRADNFLITSAFSQSKFIKEKLTLPPDIVQKTFGDRFKVEGDKLVAIGGDGNKLLSKARQGEYADLDEALGLIVDGYAAKDAILKGSNHSGGGAQGNGGGGGGVPRYSRSEYNKMTPAKQQEIGLAAGTGKAEIYDA